MRDTVANLPIKEKDVLLPSFLYKEHKGDSQNQAISPYAIFDPVAATGDNGWVSSTTPLSAQEKKTLVFGSHSFAYCKDDNYPPLALLLSLQDLGFEIYIKHDNGIAALPGTIDGLMKLLETKAPSSVEDYTTLAEEHQVARDDTVMLDEKQAKEIYMAFFSKRIGKQEVDYTDPGYATQILYKIASHETRIKVVEYCENKNLHAYSTHTSYASLFLCAASANGDLETVKYLNAETDKGDKTGTVPFHFACMNGHIEVAKYLCDRIFELDQKDVGGKTALHFACLYGHVELAMWLVENGADVNQKNNDGNTPFHLACENGHVELAKWLVEEKKVDGLSTI